MGAPEATLSAVIALLTDPQSNFRPSVMEVDAGLLECCADALCDMGYPNAAGSLRIPATWPADSQNQIEMI